MGKGLTLGDRDWRPFYLGDLYDVTRGNHGTAKEEDGNDHTPFISAAKTCNGVTAFISDAVSPVSNVIGVVNTGDGGAGYAFFHSYPALFSSSVSLLKNKVSPALDCLPVGLFVSACIFRQQEKYSRAYSYNKQRICKQRIMLPVDGDAPDWAFIQFCGQKLVDARSLAFLREIGHPDDHVLPLHHRGWGSFSLSDIFPIIERGKRLKKADHEEGDIPYISSSAQRNGVDGFISNTSGTKQAENCLTIANSGSVGFSFFHPYRFIASDHVTILKREGMSPYCYLFIAACMDKVRECYSFQREMNDLRIRRQRIMLPVDDSGLPDYNYMHQYAYSLSHNEAGEGNDGS